MEPYEENHSSEQERFENRPAVQPWLIVALIALLVAAGAALTYGMHQRAQVEQLQQQAAASTSTMNRLQSQVNTLTAKLNDMTASQTPTPAPAPPAPDTSSTAPSPASEDHADVAVATAPPVATAKPAPAKRANAKRRTAATDKRYAQLKAQLDDQQKQLKETQDEVAKNRSDLEGSISSTRDELNGSIAKTHDELVTLEKRGERSYFEFDLSKSKQFQRVGPMTLSLRKADTKHKNYDLAMIVDDNELNKKKVNLYEPIWIHTQNGSQPLQVVVNHIDKNVVHGYVSAPKYKLSELTSLSSSNASPSDSSPQPQQPQQ